MLKSANSGNTNTYIQYSRDLHSIVLFLFQGVEGLVVLLPHPDTGLGMFSLILYYSTVSLKGQYQDKNIMYNSLSSKVLLPFCFALCKVYARAQNPFRYVPSGISIIMQSFPGFLCGLKCLEIKNRIIRMLQEANYTTNVSSREQQFKHSIVNPIKQCCGYGSAWIRNFWIRIWIRFPLGFLFGDFRIVCKEKICAAYLKKL